MIFLFAALLSIAVALLRGGRFDRLSEFPFRYAPLILLGLWLQIALFTPLLGPRLTTTQVAVGYNLSMVLIWGTLLLNWRLPGVPLMTIGVFLNWLAITVNGGFMPASPQALEQAGLYHLTALDPAGRHNNSILISESTRLPFLTDVMAIPALFPLANVFSVGDLLLGAGAAWFVQVGMVGSEGGRGSGPLHEEC